MPRFSECWRCTKTSASVACRYCEVAKYCSNRCKDNDVARHTDAECRPVFLINTCLSCRKVGSSLQKCTGCYRAFYCDATCQMKHRNEHRDECKKSVEKVKLLARRLGMYFLQKSARTCMAHYYWGNIPAFDYLNLSENEGADYSSDMNLLVLGVGDLRNIVLTCASLPESFRSKIKFTLNDSDRCALARVVLFLYMLIKCDSSVGNIITEIWYSTVLSEKTYNYLIESLKGLLGLGNANGLMSATDGLVNISENRYQEINTVWSRWLDLSVEISSNIQEQRQKAMRKDPGSFEGKMLYCNTIPRKYRASAVKYMEDGVFQCTAKCSFAQNPTLTGPPILFDNEPFTYCVPTSVLPFAGWDYIEIKKFNDRNSLISMYGNYIQSKLVDVMHKLHAKQISFDLVLGDCMKIEELLNKEEKFDRILTSNLMDYILLPELLSVYSDKLNRSNDYATLITYCQNWVNFCPDGDVSLSPEASQFTHLCKILVQDTKDPRLCEGRTNFREYLDNSGEWQDYLRAIFYAYQKRYKTEETSKLPTIKQLGNEFQLRLRDGYRNENRIAFFKPAVNRRRVTMITGLERFMEWVPN